MREKSNQRGTAIESIPHLTWIQLRSNPSNEYNGFINRI